MTEREFDGRRAIVTGGCRGIGRAIADALAAAGADVHVFDVGAEGERASLPYPLRVVDVAAAIGSLPAPATLVVNNAGITRDRSLVKMSDAEWHQVLGVNLTGAFNVIRAAAPAMIAAGFGRIVNITSINGIRGKFGQANYAAAKAGLIGLTKTAARELGPKGVTVNARRPRHGDDRAGHGPAAGCSRTGTAGNRPRPPCRAARRGRRRRVPPVRAGEDDHRPGSPRRRRTADLKRPRRTASRPKIECRKIWKRTSGRRI
jgi:3-oxoacyl-[acyl-carrier protein] reductase